MEQTPFKKLLTFKKERRPSCTLCSNHGVHSNLKGHKHQCPFLTCHCELCVKGRRKRDIMKQQVRLRRKQMKEIGSRPYIVSPPRTGRDDFPGNSSVNVEPCSIENNDSPSYEDTRPFPKLGSLNGGLIQNVSSILHSPFVPRRQPFNCSAYIPTPFQLWTIGDGRVVAGAHYNNTAEHLKSSRPVENVSTSGFSVSDNSAFVKYCGQPSRFDEVSFRLGRTSSSEAAAVLASFANSECAAASK